MAIDIDTILRSETNLLVADAQIMRADNFVELASKEDLRQEDWDRFWKAIRQIKLETLN